MLMYVLHFVTFIFSPLLLTFSTSARNKQGLWSAEHVTNSYNSRIYEIHFLFVGHDFKKHHIT